MTDIGTDVFISAASTRERSAALADGFLAELGLLVRKAESGLRISGEHRSQAELERAYFRDVLQLLFNRAVEDFGNLVSGIKPTALRTQLRDGLALDIRRRASMVLIDSDLCGTILMDEFSELLAQFLKDLDRAGRRPSMAA